MSQVFISDLHLSEDRPAISRAFFHFLEQQAGHAQALYILGDLAEAWIGDDDPGQLARQIIAALRNLTDNGTDVFFIHGNRDFLVGRRFARQTGATLLPDYHLIDFAGQKILLCHGDTLCLNDTSYQKFRKKVRNPVYRWLLSHLPLSRRQRIASEWRAKSMAANSNKPANIMDVTSDAVEQLLEEYSASVLIHGHTHRPGIYPQQNGQRIVLGDWHSKGWYIEMTNDEIKLVDFDIDSSPQHELTEKAAAETVQPIADEMISAPAEKPDDSEQADNTKPPSEPAPAITENKAALPPETAPQEVTDNEPSALPAGEEKPPVGDAKKQLSLDF